MRGLPATLTRMQTIVRVNPRPNAQSVINQLPDWFAHYNEVYPHRALRYRSSRELIAQNREALSGFWGAITLAQPHRCSASGR